MREGEEEQSRALYELCSMTVHLLRSPPLRLSFPSLSPPSPPPCSSSSSPPPPQISPASFGMLFIGISVALMLFGSVIFFVGLILMPLVIALMFLFYTAGVVSNLSEIGRAIFGPAPRSYYYAPEWSYSR